MQEEHYHFIGIAGIGMSAIARLLLQQKKKVTGSDSGQSPLKKELADLGAKIYDTHSEENVNANCIVVYSSDIKPDHIELQAARRLGRPILHRSEALAHLFHTSAKPLAVAGTHGKTTTSALLAFCLQKANCNPSYAIGGICQNNKVNSEWGTGEYFVIEADESDGSFLQYHPDSAIITNIDLDHMNYYGTDEILSASFRQFALQVKSPNHLVWCGDDVRLQKLNLPGVSYGFSESCHARISNYHQKEWKSFFDLTFEGQTYTQIETSLIGEHGVLNSAAVFTLALILGESEELIRVGLREFKGTKRRCEILNCKNQITLIDDYAHHPTEIKATLAGIRKVCIDRSITAVFQPHRYSRLAHLLENKEELAQAFGDADSVIITDIYSSGEKPIEGISIESITQLIADCHHGNVVYVPKDQLVSTVGTLSKPYDVFVFLGAGDISKLCHQTYESIKDADKKLKVGLVYGGPSVEHHISINSARFVCQALQNALFEVEPFGVSRKGVWSHGDPKELSTNAPAISQDILAKLQSCDVFFSIIHGTYGEDGVVQGLFETLGKPFVGCNHRAAAVCMDKALCKKLISYHGILSAPFKQVSDHAWRRSKQQICDELLDTLSLPLIIKPSHLGSSVAIGEAHNRMELINALDLVFKADTDAIVEMRLQNVRDIEFAVLGNEDPLVFPPGEICTNGKIYSYEDKVGNNGPETETQAKISDDLIQEGMRLAKQVYEICGCRGWARVDFLLDQNGCIWFNEINPIPGCTSISLYPKMCAEHGIPSAKLAEKLVLHALAEHRNLKQKRSYLPS